LVAITGSAGRVGVEFSRASKTDAAAAAAAAAAFAGVKTGGYWQCCCYQAGIPEKNNQPGNLI